MAEPYTTKRYLTNILEVYKRILLRRPRLLIAVTIGYIGFIFAVQSFFDQESFMNQEAREFFLNKPQLSVNIQPTETYRVGDDQITIKRIALENQHRELRNVNVSIRTQTVLEDYSLSTTPRVPCKATRFSREDAGFLIQFTCETFASDQIAEIRLFTTNKEVFSDTNKVLVVEASGAYGRERFVGVSETGNWKSDSNTMPLGSEAPNTTAQPTP